MATRISGLLIARSTISITSGGTVESDLLDFDLPANGGVEISAIKSIWGDHVEASPSTSLIGAHAYASLHAESGTLEDPNFDTDDTDIDTEIIHGDVAGYLAGDDSGSAQGGIGGAMHLGAYPLEHMPDGLVVATNLTHRLETEAALDRADHTYLVYYRLLQLSRAELVSAVLRGR